MPYINVFSEGEVLRNGINDKLRQNAASQATGLQNEISALNYLTFAFHPP
jgi:hypothetical protein